MAEAFANKYGKGKFLILSAGNKPAEKVNPVVVEALKEKGIDISANKPKLITFQLAQDSDLIVTMGCPGPFFKPTIEWKLEDPKGKPIEKVREIRDQIERQVQELIEKELKGANNLKLYVGLKEKIKPAIFESVLEPSKETYPQYDIIYGPFNTREDAGKYVAAMDRGVACGEG
jgi:arsenate reductase